MLDTYGGKLVEFQSTLPCRERLLVGTGNVYEFLFQSTLPCRERHGKSKNFANGNFISIHAPV